MNKHVLLLITFYLCFSSCKDAKQTERFSIDGNWCLFDDLDVDISGDEVINYEEISFINGKVYNANYVSGVRGAMEQIISKDSLFVKSGINQYFLGVIEIVDENQFQTRINLIKRTYFRISAGNTLGDLFLKDGITEEEYYAAFKLRRNKYLSLQRNKKANQ